MDGLHKLVGKTIARIDVAEYDRNLDERCVLEVIRFTCTDGAVLHFMAEDGDSEDQYSILSEVKMTPAGLPDEGDGKWLKKFHPAPSIEDDDDDDGFNDGFNL